MDRERNATTINVGTKLLLNQKIYILKIKKKITNVEIDEIKKNVRPNICNDTEDHTKQQMVTKWSKLIHHIRREKKKVTVLA